MESTHASVIGRRMQVTAEVGISKIFPAGFGWQTAAYFAENAGMEATDLSFYLSTGIGDGIAVCMGHTAYCAIKKGVTGDKDTNVATPPVAITLFVKSTPAPWSALTVGCQIPPEQTAALPNMIPT